MRFGSNDGAVKGLQTTTMAGRAYRADVELVNGHPVDGVPPEPLQPSLLCAELGNTLRPKFVLHSRPNSSLVLQSPPMYVTYKL